MTFGWQTARVSRGEILRAIAERFLVENKLAPETTRVRVRIAVDPNAWGAEVWADVEYRTEEKP